MLINDSEVNNFIMTKQETKKWYQSRTIWVNVLIVLSGVFFEISGQLEAGASLSILGILNIFLRYLTKSEIK